MGLAAAITLAGACACVADLHNCPHCSHHPALAYCMLAVAAVPVHCYSELMHACRPLRLLFEVPLNSREIDLRAMAISTALAKVNCFTSLSFLCVSLSALPIAKMSHNAWSRKASNSLSAAKSFSSAMKPVYFLLFCIKPPFAWNNCVQWLYMLLECSVQFIYGFVWWWSWRKKWLQKFVCIGPYYAKENVQFCTVMHIVSSVEGMHVASQNRNLRQ